MREIWIIAVNVFRQLLRNRILVVLTLFALSLIGVVAFLGDLGQEAETRLGQDFGLLAVEAVGFFTVLLCHVVLLFEESELKTLSILLVKPIERWQYLGGKILGSVLLMLMNMAGMVALLLAAVLALRLPWWWASSSSAAAYLGLGCALLSAVAAFFGVLASSVPAAAVFTTFAFTLGHFTTNLLEWVQRLDNPAVKGLVRVLFWVLPNFSLFNLKENLGRIDVAARMDTVFLWPLGYGLLYGGIMFALAVWSYEHKEFWALSARPWALPGLRPGRPLPGAGHGRRARLRAPAAPAGPPPSTAIDPLLADGGPWRPCTGGLGLGLPRLPAVPGEQPQP